MDPAARLNARLAAAHPAAHAMLSGLGRRLFYPRGVPAQAAEAQSCKINATIGQLTDGYGGALPLPSMIAAMPGISAEDVVLYSPQRGLPKLRAAWRSRLSGHGHPLSNPIVTEGLTHGLSIAADLFSGPDTDVLLPAPAWGNYRQVFGTRRGARLLSWSIFKDGVFDLTDLKRLVSTRTRPTVLVLNFPSNPVGYTPTQAEQDALVDVVVSAPGPMVVICDDAYAGMVWEPGLPTDSIFHRISALDPKRVLAVKIDGATKELFFFGGRVAFMTFGADGDAAAVLEEKTAACARATVSSPSRPAQALVLNALEDPALETDHARIRQVLARRYAALNDAIATSKLRPLPFNSAFFALLPVTGDPDQHRRSLLTRGVGVVAFPGSLRIGYASVHEDHIPALVHAVESQVCT